MTISKRTILVVDDDEFNLEIIDRSIGDRYNLILENYPLNVFNIIRGNKPDVVLLDWMMPDVSGLAILAEIKGNCSTKDIKVIMVTAKFHEEDIQYAFQLGADGYISKPFTSEELQYEIERVLYSNF